MAVDIIRKGRDILPVVTRQVSSAVPLSEVVLIEKSEGVVTIETVKERIVTRQSMKEIVKELDGKDNFYACHSYLVINFDYVRSMENGYIFFACRKAEYVGEKNFAKARKKYNEYIGYTG
jgi:DNA-binding LytR/AlgR family response regulator